MKQLCMLVIMFFITSKILAQQVGIGTTSPDGSAALHIQSNNKGVLFPKVVLTSKTDENTIPDPAHGLVVFNNSTVTLDGKGLYLNMGSAITPSWEKIGKQEKFTIPYYGYLSAGPATNALEIQSDQNTANSAAIRATASGITTGLSTFSGAGLALDVQGKVKISGNGQAPGAGKVLTSDASGNATWQGAVAFGAKGVKGGGSEKLVKQTSNKIPFALEDYDIQGNYNSADTSPHSTFTAPSDGVYHFDVSVSWVKINGDIHLDLNRSRNGGIAILHTNITPAGAPSTGAKMSVDVMLLSGDQIFVSVYHTLQDYLTLQTENEFSFFTGRLVIKQ